MANETAAWTLLQQSFIYVCWHLTGPLWFCQIWQDSNLTDIWQDALWWASVATGGQVKLLTQTYCKKTVQPQGEISGKAGLLARKKNYEVLSVWPMGKRTCSVACPIVHDPTIPPAQESNLKKLSAMVPLARISELLQSPMITSLLLQPTTGH